MDETDRAAEQCAPETSDGVELTPVTIRVIDLTGSPLRVKITASQWPPEG